MSGTRLGIAGVVEALCERAESPVVVKRLRRTALVVHHFTVADDEVGVKLHGLGGPSW
jgi:hypothetical protein